MANIGTATVNITPVIDEDALSQVDTAIREAVADALRKVAASLVATSTGAVAQVGDFVRRYYVEQINGIWGVRDREVPDKWASWGEDYADKLEAEHSAARLNQGEDRDHLAWSAPGTYS